MDVYGHSIFLSSTIDASASSKYLFFFSICIHDYGEIKNDG